MIVILIAGRLQDAEIPALAPKSLSSPEPPADVLRQEFSNVGFTYSQFMTTLSNGCTAASGFASVSIS